MKIFIMTDMEGCAGILTHDDWVIPAGRYYAQGRQLLTEEVNAAVRGFLAGGASSILVADGHGAGGIDPLTLHPSAELMRGTASPVHPWGFDSTFDGIAWVGQHAKAGTDYSHITHTGWFNVIDYRINDISIGEYGEIAFSALELGIPCFFASGEEAFCREAEALTPGVVTASTKRGLTKDGLEHLSTDAYRNAKLSAIHKSPVAARTLIEKQACAAMQALRETPEVFAKFPLKAPFVKEQVLRNEDGGEPVRQTGSHPESVNALLNAPWDKA